jgi:hydroxyacylglutathione hydrolase
MIVVRSMHEQYLSNAYLVADHPGGNAVFIDSGAPLEPLFEAVDAYDLHVTHLLTTHEHHDHTLHDREIEERYAPRLLDTERLLECGVVTSGELTIRALPTPGHVQEHVALLVNDLDCFTGDVLFAGTVGGTLAGGPNGYDELRSSIMDTLLELPDEVRLHPGHMEPTTIGAERAANPFVQYWSGTITPRSERVRAIGSDATLLVWAPDYDGGHKALVAFDHGHSAIIGGSKVEWPAGTTPPE